MMFQTKIRILAICLVAGALFGADRTNGPIRFDDVTVQSGIRFIHSFGAEKLGSLLESTGAGCVWFDYNNDGKAMSATSIVPIIVTFRWSWRKPSVRRWPYWFSPLLSECTNSCA